MATCDLGDRGHRAGRRPAPRPASRARSPTGAIVAVAARRHPAATPASRSTLADDEVLLPGLVDTPRARQRAGPDRVGGLRHRHPGGRGRRRHHDRRHAAELDPAHRRRRRAGGEAGGGRRAVPRGRRLLGRRRARQRSAAWPPCTTPGCSASSASWPTRGVPEFPPLSTAPSWTGAGRGGRARRAADRARRGRRDPRRTRPAAPARVRRLPGARGPPEAEDAAIGAADRRGRARTGARVHVAAPVQRRRRCRCSRRPGPTGSRVTVETCPHYLTLAAEDVPDGATRVQVLPADPRRAPTGTRSGPAWPTATDRPAWSPTTRPARRTLKRPTTGDFGAAWGGISSLQLALPVVWTAARGRGLGLADVVALDGAGAGRRSPGCARKGAHRAGRDADLVAFAPDERLRRRPGPAPPPPPGDAVRRPRLHRGGARRPGCAGAPVPAARRRRAGGC